MKPQGQGARAVQYLRMSTEHQRYSLENQASRIGAYALERGYQVVDTYADPGRSGLTLKGRPDLKRLLADVMKPDRRFGTILVLDVSRWGRFQDPDQAAHYEFICREAGVRVVYCAEPFDDDDEIASKIMKHLKRVMAGEYSRELSDKILYAQLRHARQGYKQGGGRPYGVRRWLVDDRGEPVTELADGERPALQGYRVVFRRGPPEEARVIRRIFRWFTEEGCSLAAIARRLNEAGIRPPAGDWTGLRVRSVLRSETALELYVFNRHSSRLHTPRRSNPPKEWIRVRVMAPLVSQKTFDAAAARFRKRTIRHYTDKELLAALRALYRREGRLTHLLIGETASMPSPETYRIRFGSLWNAYVRVGFAQDGRWRLTKSQKHADHAELLELLKALYAREGKITGRLIDAAPDLPTQGTYKNRFGSLLEAYAAAGLPSSLTDVYRAAYRRQHGIEGSDTRPPQRDLSEEEMLAGLVRLHQEYGRINSVLICADQRLPSIRRYISQFGSMLRAYERAGLPHSRFDIKSRATRLQHANRRKSAEQAST